VSELSTNEYIPNPFKMVNGSQVKNNKDWEIQRIYIKEMLAHYQYGHMPPKPKSVIVEKRKTRMVYNGKAIEEKFLLLINKNGKKLTMRIGIVRPGIQGKFPVIIKNDVFLFDSTDIKDVTAKEYFKKSRRFEIQDFVNQEAIKRSYIICKFIRTDIAKDHKNNRDKGVFTLYPEYDWGTIAAWAWGYQIILDALEKESFVNMNKVVATGHSRGGKTALCAGIYDERISIAAPNSSGSGGTGSWRFFDTTQKPQTILFHEKNHHYWWTPNLFQFVDKERKLPYDAHFAKVLIAPRALINTHARHDYWANPYGTYLTYLAAQPVFDWLGVSDHNAIHWRDGGHNQDIEDWLALFDYCEMIFYNKRTNRVYNDNPFPDLYRFDNILNYSQPLDID